MMKREKSCGVLVLRQQVDELYVVLLRHRFGGHWSFPKGHVEAGESERQTALREVREETGLTGIKLMDGFRESVEYSPKPGVKKQVVYFLGTTEQEKLIRQEEEISEIMWAPLSRAAELVSFANDKRLLRHAQRRLGLLPTRKKSRIWRRRQNKMLPKKQTPLVRAETICCTLAAVIVAICLAHHPGTSWPLAVTLALLIAANVLQILRDHKDRKDEK